MRVFKKYIHGRPAVILSAVPAGHRELSVEGAVMAVLPDEANIRPEESAENSARHKTESSFDRSLQPPLQETPELVLRAPYRHTFEFGLVLIGDEQSELPLVRFSVDIEGGHRFDPRGREGAHYLLARLLQEGTVNRTPEELEEAIELLGASVRVTGYNESIRLVVTCPSRNFEATAALVWEMVAMPRFDEKEFARIKDQVLAEIEQSEADPEAVSNRVIMKLLHGPDHILSIPKQGTRETVSGMEIGLLKATYASYFTASQTRIVVAGDVNRDRAIEVVGPLATALPRHGSALPTISDPPSLDGAGIYVVDVPGAQQSHLRIARPGLRQADPEFFPAVVMNYPLGGNFSSRVNLVLREEKGYTYGAWSWFEGSRHPGFFMAGAAVQSEATGDSLLLFRELMENFAGDLSSEELSFTQNSMIKSMLREFETLADRIEVLTRIVDFGLDEDHVAQRQAIVRDMSLDRMKELARKYVTPDRMIYLVVGDAETVLPQLESLGLGPPVLLDRNGDPVDQSACAEP